MAIISCPECGKQISDRAVSCPNCGCPISAAPVVSTTQPNIAEEIEKLLVLARRARTGGDSINAKKCYTQILDKDPGNWEAIFYTVYFTASECKIMNISSSANSVANCIYSTFAAITDLSDDVAKQEAVKDIIASATNIADLFVVSAVSFYNQHSTVSGAHLECSNRVVAAGNIYSEIELGLKQCFPSEKVLLADFQKRYVGFLKANEKWLATTACQRLENEIAEVYPAYGKKKRLEAEIEELNTQIDVTAAANTSPFGCIGGFFLIVGVIMLGIGFVLSLDGEFWPFLVAVPELIIGIICMVAKNKDKPSQAQIDENNKKKQELIAKRDALQRELNSLNFNVKN